MKKFLRLSLFALILISSSSSQELKQLNIAIVKMQVSGGIPETYSIAFTDRLQHELFTTGAFMVMERGEMDEILKEQGFQMSGCTTDQCFVDAGNILGVDHIVVGSVSKIGSLFTITLRMISVETSQTIKSIVVDYKGEVEELASAKMQEAAQKLAGPQISAAPGTSYSSSPPQTIEAPLPGMTFVKIPAGSFQMGSNENSNEQPVHTVNIKSFYLMTTEVTQAQWQAVMGNNPSFFKGDNLPVEQVSWDDCQDFINKLNRRDAGKNYRLPTEAEWEYACRAGATTKYYNGDDANSIGEIAWYDKNSGATSHPVGQKRANNWGLYDMSGNVWEWCSDLYHNSYQGAPGDGSSWEAPQWEYRVMRGGSYFELPNIHPRDCRSAVRSWAEPDFRFDDLGLRLVRSS